ncbi:MAG: cytidine deaminase [Ruminococcaceae bacterium]|nr:cytidine deaminase [Oscillospiraceae bacterium]
MNQENITFLTEKATEARARSYAPYSGFAVGAALLCADGTVYTGANIEVSAHTPTMCAERVAFARAVHEGQRDFVAIAVVGGPRDGVIDSLCPPCGVCRQVMSEFCRGDFKIILTDGKTPRVLTLDDILPYRFGLNV